MADLAQPLDPAAADAAAFLDSVQGNILKSHGRDHTAHVFVRFNASQAAARGWCAELASGAVVSASVQEAQTRAWRADNESSALFLGLLLSADGYLALGVETIPPDPLFAAGMQRHNEVSPDPINDTLPTAWEPGYAAGVDAMLLLAHDDRPTLDAALSDHLARLPSPGSQAFVERGDRTTFAFGVHGKQDIEHFGHQDGISNPLMTLPEIEKERARRGARHWDPAASLSLVFIREPGQAAGFGSYMVFRKLEQNVRRFRSARAALAQALGCSEEEASGLIVGRRSDGTPLISTETPDVSADPNDFDYGSDSPAAPGPAGVCPFHAHIRRSNPRGDTVSYLGAPTTDFERGMRIVRRGVTYGARPDLGGVGEPPEKDVGLLFMSFQANLRQFAIQQSGADSADFPSDGAGLEGLNGRTAEGGDPAPQSWPTASGPILFSLGGFVTLKGGEYLFAPSLPFLKSLALPG